MKDKSTLLILLVLLYATVFTFVESNANIFGMNIIQNAAGLALLCVFTLIYTTSNKLKPKTRAQMMGLLAVVGILISCLMTYAHFGTSSEFCPKLEDGGEVACDIVNQSIYSEIAGIPVATLGIFAYAAMLFLALEQNKRKSKYKNPLYLHAVAVGGFLFTVWLNYIQFVVLKTLCLFCEFSAATIITLTIISYQNWRDD